MQVRGDGARREAADTFERIAADYRAAAAKKRRIPAILAALDDTKEQCLLGPDFMRCVGPAMLVRVQVVVILRCLDERYARVFEITERLDEKIAPRCMIGVEHRDHLAAGARESVVEIAGLRMRIISTRQILTSELGRQSSHRLPAAIIENPGALWIVHRHCRQHRLAYQVDRLAVGGDVHIDADARARRPRVALRQPPAPEYGRQGRDETKQLRALAPRRDLQNSSLFCVQGSADVGAKSHMHDKIGPRSLTAVAAIAAASILMAQAAWAVFDSAAVPTDPDLKVARVAPEGDQVPAPGRQIGVTFDRPVVAVGLMAVDAARAPGG